MTSVIITLLYLSNLRYLTRCVCYLNNMIESRFEDFDK